MVFSQDNLYRSLAYIKGYVCSLVILELMNLGLLEFLVKPRTRDEIFHYLNAPSEMGDAILDFLLTEEIIVVSGDRISLTKYGGDLIHHEGWFRLLVGGYGNVFGNLETILRKGHAAVQRDSIQTSWGSGLIGHFDAFPIVAKLIDELSLSDKVMVDVGCGNSYSIHYMCNLFPQLQAIGVEPDYQMYQEARKLIRESGLRSRVKLLNQDAVNYSYADGDFIVMAFVLHEILGQLGKDKLIEFLRRLKETAAARYLLLIEVNWDRDNLDLLRSPIGAYYSCYYLLHPLTHQQLLSFRQWEDIFDEVGLAVVTTQVADPNVDASGLLAGYALDLGQPSQSLASRLKVARTDTRLQMRHLPHS